MKHIAPATLRDASSREIEAATLNRDSLYFATTDAAAIEREVLDSGIYVRTPKPATIQKIKEFQFPIGASNGLSSRWVVVEITSGVYHGRPTTQAWFQKLIGRQMECCTEN